jgi:exodeoxyribonuclease VII small subunit
MTFEESMARLEDIVAQLDGDGLDLESSLRLFEEGVERLREASATLTRVEARVRELVERDDGTFELPDALV